MKSKIVVEEFVELFVSIFPRFPFFDFLSLFGSPFVHPVKITVDQSKVSKGKYRHEE